MDIVLLNLRISMWGVSRVLPDHEYEMDADKAMVWATKKILECPEYEFLLQLKRSIHRRLRTLALPGEILRAGVYPISVGMVEAVEKTLEDFSVLLSDQDITQLRKDQGPRELVQERMQSVKVVLDSLVEDAPTRQIVLRDGLSSRPLPLGPV
jgi:hypothetical protein